MLEDAAKGVVFWLWVRSKVSPELSHVSDGDEIPRPNGLFLLFRISVVSLECFSAFLRLLLLDIVLVKIKIGMMGEIPSGNFMVGRLEFWGW